MKARTKKRRGNICRLVRLKGRRIVKCYDSKNKLIGVFVPRRKRR